MKQRKGLIVVMAVVFVLVMCLLGACDVKGCDHKYEQSTTKPITGRNVRSATRKRT